jgi:hypothetical protein
LVGQNFNEQLNEWTKIRLVERSSHFDSFFSRLAKWGFFTQKEVASTLYKSYFKKENKAEFTLSFAAEIMKDFEEVLKTIPILCYLGI